MPIIAILADMTQFRRYTKKVLQQITWVRVVILLVIVGAVSWQLYKPEKLSPRHTVDKGVVERVVIASGKIELSNQVALGFQESGAVAKVLVKSGSKVSQGQLLAQLDLGVLPATLREARADLTEAQFKKQRSQLDATLSSDVYNSDFINAANNLEALRIKMLSSDLELLPDDSTSISSTASPVITGTYKGPGEKATFSFEFYSSAGASGISARVIGENINETIALSTSYPVAIGTTGLFMQLPDKATGLEDTSWKLHMPNTRSSSYASNVYQYLDAKKSYEAALKNQSKEISLITKGYDGMTEYDIAIERAQASVDRVTQQIRLKGIYSPVAGTIGRIDIKPGQSVSGGTDVLTVLGNGKLEAKLHIPESSVGGINYSDPVIITSDVSPDVLYKGSIATIDQAETYLEGTPVYVTSVVIDEPEGLRPGMTVRGKIIIDRRANVIRVPELAIHETGDATVIKKLLNKDTNESIDVPVAVDLRGTDGLVAITGNINSGDDVVLREDK